MTTVALAVECRRVEERAAVSSVGLAWFDQDGVVRNWWDEVRDGMGERLCRKLVEIRTSRLILHPAADEKRPLTDLLLEAADSTDKTLLIEELARRGHAVEYAPALSSLVRIYGARMPEHWREDAAADAAVAILAVWQAVVEDTT